MLYSSHDMPLRLRRPARRASPRIPLPPMLLLLLKRPRQRVLPNRQSRHEASDCNAEVEEEDGAEGVAVGIACGLLDCWREGGDRGCDVADLVDGLWTHSVSGIVSSGERRTHLLCAGTGDAMLELARQDGLEHRSAAGDTDNLTDVAEEVRQARRGRHVAPVHTRNERNCAKVKVSERVDAKQSVYLLSPAVMTEAKPKPLGKIDSHERNQPLFSSRKTKEVRAKMGKAEVMAMSQ